MSGPPDVDVAGDDAALAAAVTPDRPRRIAYRPATGADFARAVGLVVGAGARPSRELPVDAMEVSAGAERRVGMNMVVAGTAPDRLRWWSRSRVVHVVVDGRVAYDGPATTVLVANGEFLRGHDVVPRGHPGDGRLEVQVYSVPSRQRAAARTRLRSGLHLPHPGIRVTTGRDIAVECRAPLAVEIDGRRAPRSRRVDVSIRRDAALLLV